MTLLRVRDRARVWSRARPRSWMRTARRSGRCWSRRSCWRWSWCRRDIDHTSHSGKAVQGAEVGVSASLRKSVLVNEPCVIKNSGVTVHVIRRTELPIGCTSRAAGDTVVIAAPGPPHGVTHRDAECVRHEAYLFPDGPTATSKIWPPAGRVPLRACWPF